MATLLLASLFALLAVAAGALELNVSVGLYGSIVFKQTDPSQSPINATVALEFPALVDYALITENPPANASCAGMGTAFNPTGVTLGSCNASQIELCAVGEQLYGERNATSFMREVLINVTLFGTRSIRGRGIRFVLTNGTTIACATIPDAPPCGPAEYQASNFTATTARVCSPLTNCTASQYEVSAPTATTDRVCAPLSVCDAIREITVSAPNATTNRACRSISISEQAVLTVANLTKLQFYPLQSSFVSSLSSLLNGSTVRILSQSQIGTALSVTIAAIAQNGAPLESATLLRALSDLQNRTCPDAQETACACNTTDDGGLAVDASGCFALNGTAHCIPRDGAGCPSTLPASSFNLTLVPANSSLLLAGAVVTACPRPAIPSCLARNLSFTSIALASAVNTSVLVIPTLPPKSAPIRATDKSPSVATLSTLARFWRNIVQPKPLPTAWFNNFLQSRRSGSNVSATAVTAYAQDSYVVPLYVMSGFSFLFLALVPLVSGIVCCCRSCRCCACYKGCGGPRHHDDASDTQRKILLVSALLLLTLIALSLAGFYQAEMQLDTGADAAYTGVASGLDTLDAYKNNTLDQGTAIATSLVPAVRTSILAVLDSFSSGVGLQIQGLIQNASDGLLTTLDRLATDVDRAYNLTLVLDATTTQLSGNLTQLSNACSAAGTRAADLSTACNSIAAGMSGVDQTNLQALCALYGVSLSVSLSVSGAPALTSIISSLQSIVNSNLRQMGADGRAAFAAIPSTIGNITASIRTEVSQKLDTFQTDILNQTTDARKEADKALYESINLTKIKSQARDVTTGSEVSSSNQYRRIVTLSLLCTFAAVCGFVLFALCIGVCAYKPEAAPWERSYNSDYAATVLKFALFMFVILSILANLAVLILFPTISMTGKTCDLLYSDAQLSSIIDNPDNFDGNPLAKVALNNGSLPLTVFSAMQACRANQGIWSALQLDFRRNLTSLLNVDSYVNVSSIILPTSFNLNSTNIIPPAARSQLNQFNQSGITAYNFSSFLTLLQSATTNTNVTAVRVSIEQLHAALVAFNASASSHPPELEVLMTNTSSLANDVHAIEVLAANITTKADSTRAQLEFLSSLATNVSSNVALFGPQIDAFNALFWSTSQTILNPSPQIEMILSTMRLFTAQTATVIRNQLGNCQPLIAAYTNMLEATCGVTQTGYDAYWFSLALVCFFSAILMFVLLKLIKHFRINEETTVGKINHEHKRALADAVVAYADDDFPKSKPNKAKLPRGGRPAVGPDAKDVAAPRHFYPMGPSSAPALFQRVEYGHWGGEATEGPAAAPSPAASRPAGTKAGRFVPARKGSAAPPPLPPPPPRAYIADADDGMHDDFDFAEPAGYEAPPRYSAPSLAWDLGPAPPLPAGARPPRTSIVLREGQL